MSPAPPLVLATAKALTSLSPRTISTVNYNTVNRASLFFLGRGELFLLLLVALEHDIPPST